ncbi:hypothetical protein PQI64_11065 [Shewanella bicestrii]
MTLNDRMNQLIAENEQLKAEVAELKDQVSILSKRPEFDLSTVNGREQAVIDRLKNQGLVSNKAGA